MVEVTSLRLAILADPRSPRRSMETGNTNNTPMDTVVFRQRITRLEERYGQEVAELAAYIHMTRVFHSCAAASYKIDPAPMEKLFAKLVESRCIDREIYPPLLEEAVQDLERDLDPGGSPC
jgi:hypothetical protein